MKKSILHEKNCVPTLMIALADQLKAELISTLNSKVSFKTTTIITDGTSLFETLEKEQPDFLLVATDLPHFGSFGFLKKLKRIPIKTKVILYVSSPDSNLLKMFLSSPAAGFIQKGCGIAEFLSYMKDILNGQKMAFSKISDFYEPNSKEFEKVRHPKYDLSMLTEREIDIWSSLSDGKTVKQIAEALFISENTVKSHKTNITNKIGLEKKTRLSIIASKK